MYRKSHLFGASTLDNKNCVDTFQKTKFVPSFTHKNRVKEAEFNTQVMCGTLDSGVFSRHGIHDLYKIGNICFYFSPNAIKVKVPQTLVAVPATIQHGTIGALAQRLTGCSYLICDGQFQGCKHTRATFLYSIGYDNSWLWVCCSNDFFSGATV